MRFRTRSLAAVRLAAAMVLLGGGLVVLGPSADAQIPYPLVCNGTVTNNPGVPNSVPANPVHGPDGKKLYDRQNTCAQPVRTLVFVGLADIDNGVNFNGTGTGASGGAFTFNGDCVMVDWEEPDVGAPVLCNFGNTTGTYFKPGTPNGLFNPIGKEAEARLPAPLGPALRWAPENQASCFNSSGQGSSSFNVSETSGSELWSSTYTWDSSLDNLRGTVSSGSRSFLFDAKIEAQAHPAGVAQSLEPLDATAAGCLEKPINQLAGRTSNGRTGLNSILIVGTATWDLRVPELFVP